MKKLNNEMSLGIYSMLEVSRTGIIMLDKHFEIVDYNKPVLEIFNYNDDDNLRGKALINLYLEEDIIRLKKNIIQRLKKGLSWTGQIYGKKQNGSLCLQELTLKSVSDGYLLMVREKEDVLGQNIEHSCTIFDKLNDGLFKITKTGKCLSVNSALLKMFAYKNKNELKEDNFFNRMLLNQLNKKDQTYVTTIKKSNGDIVWAMLKYWKIKDSNGDVLYYEGIIKDISKEQNIMQELKNSEKKYRTFFENTGTAVMLINKDTSISMINKKMEELSGYKKEEIESKMTWMHFVAEEKKLKEMIQHHQQRRYSENKNNVPTSYEFKFKTKNGTIKHVIANVSLIKNTLESIVSLIDITERKEYEERVKYLAYHDKLTGLYNREYLEEKIKELDNEKHLPLSVIMGDINGLKLVNDAFGHEKGDDLLKLNANMLKKACRKKDIIIRWGGDEFMIVLLNTGYHNANKIREKIHQYCVQLKTELIQPSISLGVSTKEKKDQDIKETIRKAERWVYKNKILESKSVRSSILKALEETLLEKDYETEEHARRLKKLAAKMGEALDFTSDKIDDLVLLAGLHDIGKIAVSDDILLKTGPLDEEEWEKVKKHSEVGYRITKASPELSSIAEGILHHHERWDGCGYPGGLKGQNIPLASRIIAIVDAFDVMIHKRSYKDAMSIKEAVIELKNCAGSQFDPELVKIFIENVVKENISNFEQLSKVDQDTLFSAI